MKTLTPFLLAALLLVSASSAWAQSADQKIVDSIKTDGAAAAVAPAVDRGIRLSGTSPTGTQEFIQTDGDGYIITTPLSTGTTKVDVTKIAGTATSVGDGVVGAGVIRVTQANDVRVGVNPISGQTGIAGGTGVDGETVPRVSLATNVGLPAGSATIGKVDQGTGGASAWKVDGSAATQPVSGTVTANAGTGPWPVTDNSGSLTVDAAASAFGATVTPVYVASSTPQACTSVSTTTTVLASNGTRKFASIIAKSSNTAGIRFRLGATAVSTDAPLAAGQSFTLDGTAIYTGVIDAIADSGTQTVCGLEY